jgi:LmbE family N-acetylglucosaminyl deacetylase
MTPGRIPLRRILLLAACAWALSAAPTPRLWAGDSRYKADLLLIVAHPDDETVAGGLLAQMIFDRGKRVAVIYCNRGTGGGNSRGKEQAKAMGLMREIEARRALASFGINNSWFLNGRDTPGQDVFRSLQNWNHGAVLEDVVRIVRLTQPEVILTWLPHIVAGENHGDHQASGVIATEAFDLAGDPTAFPAQVAPAREATDIDNAADGLEPWQPKKLYFVSDATEPIVAEGPAFDLKAISPSRKEPYIKLAADLSVPHLTQGDVSAIALECRASGNYDKFFEYMSRFKLIFAKAVVPCAPTGDVFDGTGGGPAPFVRVRGYVPERRSGVTLELGGAYAFYRGFWPAHGIERIAKLSSSALELSAGSYLSVPLLLSNAGPGDVQVTLTAAAPEGWEAVGAETYTVPANTVLPVQTFARTGEKPTDRFLRLTWKGEGPAGHVGEVSLDVKLTEWSLPQ